MVSRIERRQSLLVREQQVNVVKLTVRASIYEIQESVYFWFPRPHRAQPLDLLVGPVTIAVTVHPAVRKALARNIVKRKPCPRQSPVREVKIDAEFRCEPRFLRPHWLRFS